MNIHGDAKTIAAAFIAARGEMSATVSKDAKGNFGRYVTLAAIVEATTPAFAKHGLAIVQEAGRNEEGVTVDTWLIHESGATMQFGTLTIPLGDGKPQTVGSALTYGRRYALAAVCGLAPDDDDGQAAQDSYKPRNAPRMAQRAVEPPAADTAHDELWEPEEAPAPAALKDKVVSQAQLSRLHILGQQVYGDAWDEQRKRLVESVSKGAITSSKQLSPDEATTLIRGIESKLAAQVQATEPVANGVHA